MPEDDKKYDWVRKVEQSTDSTDKWIATFEKTSSLPGLLGLLDTALDNARHTNPTMIRYLLTVADIRAIRRHDQIGSCSAGKRGEICMHVLVRQRALYVLMKKFLNRFWRHPDKGPEENWRSAVEEDPTLLADLVEFLAHEMPALWRGGEYPPFITSNAVAFLKRCGRFETNNQYLEEVAQRNLLMYYRALIGWGLGDIITDNSVESFKALREIICRRSGHEEETHMAVLYAQDEVARVAAERIAIIIIRNGGDFATISNKRISR